MTNIVKGNYTADFCHMHHMMVVMVIVMKTKVLRNLVNNDGGDGDRDEKILHTAKIKYKAIEQ